MYFLVKNKNFHFVELKYRADCIHNASYFFLFQSYEKTLVLKGVLGIIYVRSWSTACDSVLRLGILGWRKQVLWQKHDQAWIKEAGFIAEKCFIYEKQIISIETA